MSIRTKFLVVGGDTLVIIDRLRDQFTGQFITGAMVNAEVFDDQGASVFGPTAMIEVVGMTNGRYRISIPDSLPWVENDVYTLHITTTAGGRAFDGRLNLQAKPFTLKQGG